MSHLERGEPIAIVKKAKDGVIDILPANALFAHLNIGRVQVCGFVASEDEVMNSFVELFI